MVLVKNILFEKERNWNNSLFILSPVFFLFNMSYFCDVKIKKNCPKAHVLDQPQQKYFFLG